MLDHGGGGVHRSVPPTICLSRLLSSSIMHVEMCQKQMCAYTLQWPTLVLQPVLLISIGHGQQYQRRPLQRHPWDMI